MELPTFTPLEWRMLAGARAALAERERKRAEAIGGREARAYVISAEGYERLDERCMRLAKP